MVSNRMKYPSSLKISSKKYDNSDVEYFLGIDIKYPEYPEHLGLSHNKLSFLPHKNKLINMKYLSVI